jgi:hypothetical protein
MSNMSIGLNRKFHAPAVILGIVTLFAAAGLLVQDAMPGLFEATSHNALAASALTAIAIAYLIHQCSRRREPGELLKAILLAAAFLFWAANQFWPSLPQATLFNDLAVALFVLDVFLAIVGWPAGQKEQVLSGDCTSSADHCCDKCSCCGGDLLNWK